MNGKKKLLTKACALILSLFIAVAILEIGGLRIMVGIHQISTSGSTEQSIGSMLMVI